MNKDLKQELKWINENLKALVMNENIIYSTLKNIEAELKEQKKNIDNKA